MSVEVTHHGHERIVPVLPICEATLFHSQQLSCCRNSSPSIIPGLVGLFVSESWIYDLTSDR